MEIRREKKRIEIVKVLSCNRGGTEIFETGKWVRKTSKSVTKA